MGDFVFVVLVLGGLGVFFYRQSQEKQAQRAAEKIETAPCAPVDEPAQTTEPAEEPQAPKTDSADVVAEPEAEEPVVEKAAAEEPPQEEAKAPSEEAYDALTWRVLQRVMEQPGIMQTEIYGLFPKENRKHLQATLLQLDKENVLRREKEGNTYRLFPV